MGPCIKLWLVFPPTATNLGLMASAEGQKAKLVRIGRKLEGGLLLRQSRPRAFTCQLGAFIRSLLSTGDSLWRSTLIRRNPAQPSLRFSLPGSTKSAPQVTKTKNLTDTSRLLIWHSITPNVGGEYPHGLTRLNGFENGLKKVPRGQRRLRRCGTPSWPHLEGGKPSALAASRHEKREVPRAFEEETFMGKGFDIGEEREY